MLKQIVTFFLVYQRILICPKIYMDWWTVHPLQP